MLASVQVTSESIRKSKLLYEKPNLKVNCNFNGAFTNKT